MRREKDSSTNSSKQCTNAYRKHYEAIFQHLLWRVEEVLNEQLNLTRDKGIAVTVSFPYYRSLAQLLIRDTRKSS